MIRGDRLWVNVDGSWQEASYEFRVENNPLLGQHSVMLASGGGRRVVCSCCTGTEEPPKPSTPDEFQLPGLDHVWRCSCCGEMMPEFPTSDWRWNGTAWEHWHGQGGYFVARDF